MDRKRQRAEHLGPVTSPELHRLYDYWLERHHGDRLPGRSDVDPLELRFILGNLILVDVLREPLRFRYRLLGSNLTRFSGMELTGKMLDEHPDPTFRRIAIGHYTDVTTTARPFGTRHDMVMDGRRRRYDLLMLPLAADGVTVDVIMVGMWYGPPSVGELGGGE